MYLLGFSLNNLSLMALTIATGFVVDDAIVMIENIARYIEAGEAPLAAALKGAEQIGFTILSLTVSLIAVLIPLLFMGDVVGRLFREFAVTLGVTILISARRLAHADADDVRRSAAPHPGRAPGALLSLVRAASSTRIIDALRPARLRWVLRHQPATLLVAAATLVLTVALYVVVPKGFFPMQDTGVIQASRRRRSRSRFRAMADAAAGAGATSSCQDPAVASLSSFIGVDGTNVDAEQRPHPRQPEAAAPSGRSSATDVIRRLQPRWREVEGITLFMQPVQDLTVEDRVSRTQYQYSLEDPDAARARTPGRRGSSSACARCRSCAT